MSLGELGLLLIAGVGAGISGSTAGLASLVSYPALLLLGLSPVMANVTNSVALIGSSAGAVAGSRPELAGQARTIRRWLPIAVAGGGAGAASLLLGPPGTFGRIVPYLVALASVLMLVGPRIRAASRRRSPQETRSDGGPLVPVALFLGFAYAGYFGAGAGVMILALLLVTTDRSLPVANALKNLMLGVANGVAAVAFAVTADVAWSAVPPLLIGCLIGGRLGPVVVRVIPPSVLRWVIGLAGLALAVRLWLG